MVVLQPRHNLSETWRFVSRRREGFFFLIIVIIIIRSCATKTIRFCYFCRMSTTAKNGITRDNRPTDGHVRTRFKPSRLFITITIYYYYFFFFVLLLLRIGGVGARIFFSPNSRVLRLIIDYYIMYYQNGEADAIVQRHRLRRRRMDVNHWQTMIASTGRAITPTAREVVRETTVVVLPKMSRETVRFSVNRTRHARHMP